MAHLMSAQNRRVCAHIVLTLIALIASAQLLVAQAITSPVTFTVFSRQNRAAGTYLTGTATVPDGVGYLGIKDTMTAAVASNTANSFTLTIQVAQDGVTWQDVHTEYWQGGTYVNKQGQTVARHIDTIWADSRMQQGQWTGWSVRARLVQNNTMSVGLEATVYPIGWTF